MTQDGIRPVEIPNSAKSDRWPTFVGGKVAVCRWTNAEKNRRVYLVALRDGLLTYRTEYFSDDPLEMNWCEDTQGASYYDCQDAATAEVHGKFPWSRDVALEFPPHG